MALSEIAYTVIAGRSVVIWFGILGFTALLGAGLIGYLTTKGIRVFPAQLHRPLGILSVILATIHVVLALSGQLGL